MSQPLKPDDPCYWMLERGIADPSWRTPRVVHRAGCYICEDPEFSLMGLPLCYPCAACGGHVAADDTHCDGCGADQEDLWESLGLRDGGTEILLERLDHPQPPARCRSCGCSDNDCFGCVARTGEPCSWVEPDLCSACVERTRDG